MQISDFSSCERNLRWRENMLFFKRWIKHPLQMGTIAPITVNLADLAAKQIDNAHSKVVEIGAGTGRLTRSLLKAGIKPENLTVVELDKDLCDFLKETLPLLKYCQTIVPQIIHGDASHLDALLPSLISKVDVVISAIPFMYIPPQARENILNATFKILKPNGKMFHITYNPKSPLEFMTKIHQERVGQLWFNVPPGFVWKYSQDPS